MATKTLTNQQTNFAADSNADVTVATNAGNSDDNTQRVIEGGWGNFNPSKVTVTTSSTAIVSADTTRVKLRFVNLGTNTIFLNDGTATVDNFPLRGGATENFDGCTSAINGITASGTSDLRVMEGK